METKVADKNARHPDMPIQGNVGSVKLNDWVGVALWTTIQSLLWASLICVIFLAVPEFQRLLEEFEIGTTWITEYLFATSKFLRRFWHILLFALPGLIVADASLQYVANLKPELRIPIRLIRFFPLAVVTLWIAIGMGLPALEFL